MTLRSAPERIRETADGRAGFAADLLDALAACSADGPGITRMAYGPGEQAAHAVMRETASALGLEVTTDAAGSLCATLPGLDRARPRWISGSHVDSVPNGGNFDGAAGAVAAFAALAALKDIGHVPPCDLTVMVIRAGGPHLSAADVAGYAVLHIEQGPVLSEAGLPVGIVTGIRGAIRAREARCLGAYAHSGAVPQDMRRDALLATVALIHALDRACEGLRDAGEEVVFAVGKLNTDPAAESLTKVPGEARFTLDLRSQSGAVLARMRALIEDLAGEIGRRRNVTFELGRIAMAEPAAMDLSLRAGLARCAQALHIPTIELPCGAGHDAAEFSRAGIPSAMIFVRNRGESHNPDGRMDLTDFAHGTALLTQFLAEIR